MQVAIGLIHAHLTNINYPSSFSDTMNKFARINEFPQVKWLPEDPESFELIKKAFNLSEQMEEEYKKYIEKNGGNSVKKLRKKIKKVEGKGYAQNRD